MERFQNDYPFRAFIRFFNFKGLLDNSNRKKYFNDLYHILDSINKFNEYSKELNNSFINLKDKSNDNFVNGDSFIIIIWRNYLKEYESLSINLADSHDSDISEIGKPIGLKLKLLISKVNNTEVSYNVKEIFDLISDIDNELRMLSPMIQRIIIQKIAKLIKKYDFDDSSMENLLALE